MGDRSINLEEVAALKSRVDKLAQKMPGKSPGDKNFEGDLGQTGEGNSEVLRLKARAEILSRRIEDTSKQMASIGACTSPKSPSKKGYTCIHILLQPLLYLRSANQY